MVERTIQVALLMGSASDWPKLEVTVSLLKKFGIAVEARALSAHRTPAAVHDFIETAEANGCQVFIAAAGLAAHLAGAVAAKTVKPVIGIPVEGGALNGFDALLSTVQMPGGIPVATVAVGSAGAKNAAYLALQILALQDATIAEKLLQDRAEQAKTIINTQLT